MSLRRWLLVLVGILVWAGGVWVLVRGSYVGGGALILTGGLLLVVAAGGGWGAFVEGLSNWLYFWR